MLERGSIPDAGSLIGGKYSITRVIGAGGMGIVYEALHTRLRQRVAIKMLLPQFAGRGDIVARFEREARAAAQLRSPHVARILDVDALHDGAPYMVMEFLEGRDLAAELAARGPLPIAEAVDYLLQACDAMAEAHRVGTVHRDLKPANLFLANDGRRSIVKVLDFGISKVAGDGTSPSVTSTFSALGTALYMSPEQVRSAKHVDARSDVWALGVVLYELLACRPPFEGETATAVAAAVVADPPTPLRTFRPDVPEQLESIVMTALEKDRTRRFQDAAAFAGAIAPFSQTVSRPVEPAGLAAVSASPFPAGEDAPPAARVLKDAMPLEEEDTVLLAQHSAPPHHVPPVAIDNPVVAIGSPPNLYVPSAPATAAAWSGASSRVTLSGSRRYVTIGAASAALIVIALAVAAFSGGGESTNESSASSTPVATAPSARPSVIVPEHASTPPQTPEIPILDLSHEAARAPDESSASNATAAPPTKPAKPPAGTSRPPEPTRTATKAPTTIKPSLKAPVRKGGAGLPDDPG